MSILFAEIQTKFLSGSGCVVGDTSVTISNFVDILGNAITMSAYFGSMGWATHEQGTPNERQITFTNIVVNGNGTSTLTGVNTNRMYSPFDVVAVGEDIDHAGGTSIDFGDSPGLLNQFGILQNNSIITGNWTAPNQLSAGSSFVATEDDIASAITGASGTATNLVFGTVKLSKAALVSGNPVVIGINNTQSGNPVTANNNVEDVNDTSNGVVYTATTISFTAPSTISDSGSGFVTANLIAGSEIVVSGSASNNGTYQIATVSAGAITIVQTSIVNEIAGATDTITTVTANKLYRMPAGGTLPASGANVQVFTTSGTWTKPAGAKSISVVVLGSGAGGGSGISTGSSNACGGSGGGGGEVALGNFNASVIGATVTVTVGAGGAGGVYSSGGHNGVDGATSSFGTWVQAGGGSHGLFGATSTQAGGAGGNFVGTTAFSGGAGGESLVAGPDAGVSSIYGAGGGGAGGGNVGTPEPGAQGGTVQSSGVGGGSGQSNATIMKGYGGEGGTGGNGVETGNAFNGVGGGFPGGGGGGGGSAVSATPGNGGAGAGGTVIVYTYF